MKKIFYLCLLFIVSNNLWAKSISLSLREDKVYSSIKKQNKLEHQLKLSLIEACEKIHQGTLSIDKITVSYIEGSSLSNIPFATDIDDEVEPSATIVSGECQVKT